MKFQVIILFLSLTFISSCEKDNNVPLPDQTWSYAGLGQNTVNEIKIVNDQILVATRNGMFKKSINVDDTSWIQAGLAGQVITDFVAFDADEILAAVEIGPENPDHTFYKTEDGGETWSPMQSNFGGEQGSQTCYAMDMHPDQPHVLYARGIYNVAKSADRGQTWESVLGEWEQIGYQADLIHIDANNTDIVWAGGETSIFSPYLAKSSDAGQTWQGMNIPSQGDNAVYSIAIDPNNSDHVLIGMEGQIIMTEDGGSSWSVLFSPENYSYINDMQVSTLNQSLVYAAGTDGGNALGDIIVYSSADFGNNWESAESEGMEGKDYAAQDLALYTQQEQELVYVGTNHGVFIYQL